MPLICHARLTDWVKCLIPMVYNTHFEWFVGWSVDRSIAIGGEWFAHCSIARSMVTGQIISCPIPGALFAGTVLLVARSSASDIFFRPPVFTLGFD